MVTDNHNPYPDFNDLRLIVALADSGSMTAAAKRLGLTQSAVSHALKKLERRWQTRLADRAARPLRLTPAGSVLCDHARRLLAQAEALDRAVQSVNSATVPALKLGLIDSFSATVGPKLIRALGRQAHQIVMWSGISPGLESSLLNRELDFIVAPDPLATVPNLEHIAILSEPFIIVTAREQTADSAELTLQQRARQAPLARYSRRSRIGQQIDQHLRWLRVDAQPQFEFDGTEAVLSLVAEGLGWAITTPLCLLQSPAYLPRLRSQALPAPGLTRTLYLIGHQGEFESVRATLVEQSREILQSLLGDQLISPHDWLKRTIRFG